MLIIMKQGKKRHTQNVGIHERSKRFQGKNKSFREQAITTKKFSQESIRQIRYWVWWKILVDIWILEFEWIIIL